MKKIDSNDGGHYCNYSEIQKIIVLKNYYGYLYINKPDTL